MRTHGLVRLADPGSGTRRPAVLPERSPPARQFRMGPNSNIFSTRHRLHGMLETESGRRKAGQAMASGDVDAHRRGVAIAADEYARSVTEAAGIHRGAVARLIA